MADTQRATARKGSQFYGRRKGHPLTAMQQQRLDQLLPHLRPDLSHPAPEPLTSLFHPAAGAAISDVWLEIGFGGGEHAAWQAIHHPHIGLLAAEPFVNGVAALAGRIEADGLTNIRIHDDEAQPLLGWLPPASIARAFILFPDPWPKRRHWKRRIVSPATVSALARVMSSGAQLRVATDIGDYARTTLMAIMGNQDFSWPALSPDDWRLRPSDWPPTRYEAKAVAAQRRCYYFKFVRR